ncbi:rabenosyn-5 [Microplitis demolitor]|uniref:rabenosyn-5 n=1 Tax=Microplitis demolitor TaxID=69319 RepID=UPI0004CD26BC|nr:rabenosyn-5 [Microplitis demolitor]
MAENVPILEGFLCPVCMTDLKKPCQLTKHFEEVHNDDPEILKSLKDLFGKAKKKILKQDEMPDNFSHNVPIREKQLSPDINWGPQEIGAVKSYTVYYRDIRNAKLERYSTETNKLLIRLDKLLLNLPSDPIDRKAHERTIVPWIDDKDVKLCPNCARSFHLARRKHHCRLCGAVMCHDCTEFLSLIDARKMTSPTSVDDSSISPTSSESPLTDRIIRAGIGLSKIARSPSSGSLNSILSLMNDRAGGEQYFRLCFHCKNLLDAREKLKVRHLSKPIISKFYETMRTYMEEAMRFMTMYNKMWESLSKGEMTYDLRDAQILRIKIAKVGENVDNISKKIIAIGTADIDNPPQGQALKLHQMIRASAMIFLKEQLLTIPSLPSEEEYLALQENRRQKIEERIAYERQLEIEEALKERRRDYKVDNKSSQNITPIKNNETLMETSQGWTPSGAVAILPSASIEPIIEQMSNLRSYIKQAKAECKFDEVATLESNLRELQSAYFAMKQNSDG